MAFITINQDNNADSVNLTSKEPVGPLAALYKNKFQSDRYVYPRDLGSSYRGHYIDFQFLRVKPSSLDEITNQVKKVAGAAVGGAAVTVAAGAAAGVAGAAATNSLLVASAATVLAGGATAYGVVSSGVDKIISSEIVSDAMFGDTTGISISPEMVQTSDNIKLYMPETLEFSYESNYSDLSIGEALGESMLTSGFGGRAITSAIQDPGAKLALNKAGYVYNPQQQLLFNGIDFRTYQMSFTFTPYSKAEAEAVKNIIRAFRKCAAPTVVTEAAGFFFNPPGMVDIKFYKDGVENTNLHKLKRCVLESVTVNYAPNGWTAMQDGMPMQTTMTLSFKETQLVDSNDISKGY